MISHLFQPTDGLSTNTGDIVGYRIIDLLTCLQNFNLVSLVH